MNGTETDATSAASTTCKSCHISGKDGGLGHSAFRITCFFKISGESSSSIAVDWGTLREYDASTQEDHLFSDIDREADEQKSFNRLVELVKPVVQERPSLRGGKLAIAMFDKGMGIDEAFGRYTGPDFTNAARKNLGLPLRKRKNAKKNID